MPPPECSTRFRVDGKGDIQRRPDIENSIDHQDSGLETVQPCIELELDYIIGGIPDPDNFKILDGLPINPIHG